MTKQNTLDAIKYWFDCNAGFKHLPDDTPINQTDLGMELTIGDMRQLLNSWQPIGTAPKGKKIQIASKNSNGSFRRCIGIYIEKFTLEATEDDDCDDDWYDFNEANEEYYAPAGWYEYITHYDDLKYYYINDEVLFWQPLPPLPELEK